MLYLEDRHFLVDTPFILTVNMCLPACVLKVLIKKCDFRQGLNLLPPCKGEHNLAQHIFKLLSHRRFSE